MNLPTENGEGSQVPKTWTAGPVCRPIGQLCNTLTKCPGHSTPDDTSLILVHGSEVCSPGWGRPPALGLWGALDGNGQEHRAEQNRCLLARKPKGERQGKGRTGVPRYDLRTSPEAQLSEMSTTSPWHPLGNEFLPWGPPGPPDHAHTDPKAHSHYGCHPVQ